MSRPPPPPPSPPPPLPTSHDLTRIAVRAIVSVRTVQRVYQGLGSAYSRRRVREAAIALELPAPPEPQHKAA
jgi:hypothetical protein